MGARREAAVGLALALAAAILALYARTSSFGYVFDDDNYILRNPGLAMGLGWPGLRWSFTAFFHANWHPLAWISHLVDRALFGPGPGSAHLVNAAFHALCAAVLLLTWRRLSGALWPSAFAAALFALHPLRVESVAWVTERKDSLSAIFWVLAVAAYLRYARRPSPARYASVAALFALGLMTKPMVVTFPLALLLLDYWPLGRFGRQAGAASPRRLLLEKLPLLALAAASAAVTVLAQRSSDAVVALERISLASRLGNAAISYASYLRLTLWPSGLAVYYPLPVSIPAVQVGGAALLVAALTAAALWSARPRPWLATGWLWYLLTLLPVIGIVQVGEQTMADRFTYLPAVGIAIAIAWEASRAARSWRRTRRALAAVGGTLLLLLASLTLRQIGYWRDAIALYTHALAVTGENAFVAYALGERYDAAGRTEEAQAQYRAALRARPHHFEALLNLGIILAQRGERAAAADLLRRALAVKPTSALAHTNYGALLAELGREPDAIVEFGQALRLDPALLQARINLATLLAGAGRTAEASAHLREALRRDPSNTEARWRLERLEHP